MRILCIVSCKFVARLQKKLKKVRGLGRRGESPLAPWLLGAGEPGKTVVGLPGPMAGLLAAVLAWALARARRWVALSAFLTVLLGRRL